jgi:hypothetical protein
MSGQTCITEIGEWLYLVTEGVQEAKIDKQENLHLNIYGDVWA